MEFFKKRSGDCTLNYLYDSLTGFRNVFSRDKTWLVFVMIVLKVYWQHRNGRSQFLLSFLVVGNTRLPHVKSFFSIFGLDSERILSHWFLKVDY